MLSIFQVGALIFVLLAGLLLIESAPDPHGPVAVITNPWGARSAIEVIAAADGAIVRAGPWPWLAVAIDANDPGFRARLAQSGALLVVSPIALGACLGTDPSAVTSLLALGGAGSVSNP